MACDCRMCGILLTARPAFAQIVFTAIIIRLNKKKHLTYIICLTKCTTNIFVWWSSLKTWFHVDCCNSNYEIAYVFFVCGNGQYLLPKVFITLFAKRIFHWRLYTGNLKNNCKILWKKICCSLISSNKPVSFLDTDILLLWHFHKQCICLKPNWISWLIRQLEMLHNTT